MRTKYLLALCALFLIATAGCGGGGDSKSNVVTGVVLDSVQADLPVEGATITIGGAVGQTTTRDQASASRQVGSFRLTGAEVGASIATIQVTGKPTYTVAFLPSITTGTNPALTLYLNIGQVRGRVLDEAGKPVKNAFVVVNTDLRSVTTFTFADGTFLADLVPDGSAEVTAGSGAKVATKTITVVNGLNDIGDLTLAVDPNPNPPDVIKTIAGKITLGDAPNPAPGAGASVFLLRNGVQLETTTADAAGKYFFAVPAGNYTVRAIASGFVDGEAPASLADPNHPITVDLNLLPR